ncbi:oligosaccharide flippase family protein [Robertkochia flava]|uniref:oligosaccharide flippase family protein n=1 Tax=Robertkochia flava TaxID=3447986 RepID=UPI001CC9B09E|nr:lipopolysaccharide biosynthesis protein [Robertkochia marina]
MGIVKKQSLANLMSTYVGFGIGAVNTIFLYTYFLTDTYYGLVTYLLSTANLLMPVLAFGVQNTLVKFYTSFSDTEERRKFTAMMLFLPLLVAVVLGGIGVLTFKFISSFLTAGNEVISDYIWTIYIIGFAMAYFEVFYAWARVHLRSVFGNFLKEVFPRICIMLLLLAVSVKWLDVKAFIYSLVWVYLLRMLLMALSAARTQKPSLEWGLPSRWVDILKYTVLIIIGGSVAAVFLDIDRFMINQYEHIENIAYYSVAVYIAVVIAVPARALHQITYPLTSKLMNERNHRELAELYRKSSINLLVVSGLIFVLIMVNIEQLYMLLPDSYRGGITVVFLISLAKLSDNLIGNNNAIIYNSNYYRMVLLFGLLLAVLTVVLNMIFIPLWGINGAAFASLLAFLIYNASKLWYIKRKMGLFPLTGNTVMVFVIMFAFLLVFYFWSFPFHPILNIILKSVMVVGLYLYLVYHLKVSVEINEEIDSYIKKGKP